jgi:adenylate cyclase
MNLQFKSKKLVKLIVILAGSLLSGAIIYLSVLGNVWTTLDFQVLDYYYRLAVKYGYGPTISPKIVYITITDGFYDYFNKNVLDRANLAKINDALARYNPEEVAYDIIFAYPSDSHADQLFKASLKNLGSLYLPIGFSHAEKAEPFIWKKGDAYERLRTDYLKQPIERGDPHPLYAIRALMQMDDFSEAASNSGHITVFSDPDGVYRHIAMLLRVDSLYVPTLALAMFLDYVRVPFEDIMVDWGNEIVIPAKPGSTLDKDVIIPIDTRGMVFIPYAQVWNKSFNEIEAHKLLQYSTDEDLQGNLAGIIEGNFAIIADISTGFDLGQTPLEHDVPRVALHASLLNGLLTDTFYRAWSFWQVIGLMCLIVILLTLSALPRSSWILYMTGGTIFVGILGLTWFEFVNFSLFPIATVEASVLCIFFGLIIGLEIAISKDQAFIRNAFSKYVPEKVVNELLVHPELLKLGGEERVLSVLFSDLENFTGIAENMSPSELVSLLNEYLSEMTEIILAQGGVIDKFQGDAIMAEFGAPLALPNHADMAVRAGLIMQRRLYELCQIWAKRGLPALRCRVGINTGPMVIGNMGSHQVFDYTVMGDAVNLASRLEGANKLYDTYLVISEFTYEHLSPDMFLTRMLDVIKVKGKSKAVKVFEIYGENSEMKNSKDLLYYQMYHEAFEAYLSRNFATAREQFVVALSLRPGDLASQTMLARIDTLDPHNLPDNWDGSVALQSK